AETHAEHFGGSCLNTSGAFQGKRHVVTVELFAARFEIEAFANFWQNDRSSEAVSHVSGLRRDTFCHSRAALYMDRQTFCQDRFGSFERHGALDHVLELAYVARPLIPFEQNHGIACNGAHRLPEIARVLL